MTRSTRAPKVSRTPTGHDQPDDGPTTPTDPDADTLVVVAHHHGHTPDLHPRGGDPHYMDDSGHAVFGTWEPPDTLPYEYLGDQRDAHPDDHRHQNTAVSNHETGREPHQHPPLGGRRLPIEATDPDANENQARDDTYDPAEVEASQARHPSGHEPADEALPSYAAEIERQLAETRAARDRLDAIPAPLPPATPIREGAAQHGTSIAHPGALNLLNTVHHIKDDGLNHEMTWLSILLPLAVEIATYHADNRAEGGAGPELAPIELLMRTRDALEHIVLPRLAREARP